MTTIADHPDYASDAWDDLSFWSSHFGALLFDHLELRPNVVGLDVACGSGFPLFELVHAHGPGSHFTGVDIWPDAIERATRKLAVYELDNVVLLEGDAAQLPFPDQHFDLITSNLGINNFDDPPRAMAECFRVAKGGARVVVTTNLTGHMAPFYDLFRTTLRESGREDLVPALDAQEAHRGTTETIEALLENAGFEVTRLIHGQFFLRYANGTAMLNHPLVGFFKDGWMGVTRDTAIWRTVEEKLNAASPLQMPVPMLYAEGVRR